MLQHTPEEVIRDLHAARYSADYRRDKGAWWDDLERALIVRGIRSRESLRVVDAGAGVGRLAHALSIAGCSVVALDISLQSLRVLRDRQPGEWDRDPGNRRQPCLASPTLRGAQLASLTLRTTLTQGASFMSSVVNRYLGRAPQPLNNGVCRCGMPSMTEWNESRSFLTQMSARFSASASIVMITAITLRVYQTATWRGKDRVST
jgi:hypothetical protein